MEDLLMRFVGNTVLLSTSSHRVAERQEDFGTIVLSYNPVIIKTKREAGLKENLCTELCRRGYVALAADEQTEHLICGLDKNVPVTVFVDALRSAHVVYIRLIQFGMKQDINEFQEIPNDILHCGARNDGYPRNLWDLAVSTRIPHLFAIRVGARHNLPIGTNLDQYVMYTAFDQRASPRCNHGGNFTITIANPNQDEKIVKVKVYNLLYHFLRACHRHKFASPTTTRAGSDYIEKAKNVLSKMEENADLLGGLRIETTLAATTLEEAYDLASGRPYKL